MSHSVRLLALLLLAAPAALAQTDLIVDGSFENWPPTWNSTTSSGTTPFCSDVGCGAPAHTGSRFVYLGGIGITNDMSVSQTVTIPAGATSAVLTYYLQLSGADDGSGEFRLWIDSNPLVSYTEADLASFPDYVAQNVDLSFFADGQPHTIRFVGTEVDGTSTNAYFGALLDDVSLVVTGTDGGEAPINDFLFAASPIRATAATLTGTNVGADVEGTFNPDASCVTAGSDGGNAVWWMFTATNAGQIEVSVAGTFDTILTVLTLAGSGETTEVACNDDRTPGDTSAGSVVTFTTAPGVRYFVRVTGYNGESGELTTGTIRGVTQPVTTFVAESPNDHVGQAPGVLLFSKVPGLYPDTNIGATEEVGEPLASCVLESQDGRNSVWRSVVASADGTLTIDWSGSHFDTIGSVYEVSSAGGITEVACNDDFEGSGDTRVVLPVTAGTTYAVRTVGFNGLSGVIRQSLTFEPTPVATESAPGDGLRLAPPSPNPSAGSVRLAATLPESGAVRVEVLDALGRTVALVHDGPVAAGDAAWTWDASGQPAGVYVVRLVAGGAVRTQRVTVVR